MEAIKIPETKQSLIKKFLLGCKAALVGMKNGFVSFFSILKNGNLISKLSYIIMGLGCFLRGQIVKGLLFLGLQLCYIVYMATFGWGYLKNFLTLGTNAQNQIWDEELQIYRNVIGDNSMLILLFSVVTIFVTIAFILVYVKSVRAAYQCEMLKRTGEKPKSFIEDLKSLLDENYHKTLLALPTLGVICFTVLPLIFMILIAFTNFDQAHQPPGNLFTWVGLQNFKDIFWDNPLKSRTFTSLLSWTLVWAVCATFSNYIFGMILALLINKKGIKAKGLWRTIFILTIAVPQFVTLLLMSKMLDASGPVNALLMSRKLITSPINFLTNGTLARITVIIVNMWVGIPYTMLITSGILMNIPEDLYESARMDGAGPVTIFFRITLPYMLFVTTPYLITQFIGNINNFNVIFFLTGGGPKSLKYYQAGETDLLVTWLYKLTVNFQDYSLASTIGIMIFVVCSVVALITYNRTAAVKKEDTFQ